MFLDIKNHNANVTDLANAKVGESVTVSGMIHNVRVTKWGGFIVLRKSRGLLQAVVSNESSKFFDEQGAEISGARSRRSRCRRPPAAYAAGCGYGPRCWLRDDE